MPEQGIRSSLQGTADHHRRGGGQAGVSFAASSSIRRPRRIATGQRSPAERLLRSARIARSALDGRGISIANRKRMQAGYTETGSTWPFREAEDAPPMDVSATGPAQKFVDP